MRVLEPTSEEAGFLETLHSFLSYRFLELVHKGLEQAETRLVKQISEPEAKISSSEYNCEMCTMLNPIGASSCIVCATPNPNKPKVSKPVTTLSCHLAILHAK